MEKAFAMVGYVVEQWEDEEKIAQLGKEYTEIKERVGVEKWDEIMGAAKPAFEKYINGEAVPHWFGVRGGKYKAWAVAYKLEREIENPHIKYRIVKAGFPVAHTWTGYTVL